VLISQLNNTTLTTFSKIRARSRRFLRFGVGKANAKTN
jgi:hypothetical protein